MDLTCELKSLSPHSPMFKSMKERFRVVKAGHHNQLKEPPTIAC
jgi:hypothetical protein